jgi:serine/threonine protein kinase
MVQEGAYENFSTECITNYSKELLQLIRDMLEVDPKKRISVAAAL